MDAMDYFSRIQTGHDNAVKRPFDMRVDRQLRRMIEDANNNGDCIINNGKGYFRPDPHDAVDAYIFKAYRMKEYARASAICGKLEKMRDSFREMQEVGQ